MKKLTLVLFALLALIAPASAQVGFQTTGGMTRDACINPTVTASSAYTAGNIVGGLLQITPSFRSVSAQGAPDSGGIVQSVRLEFRDTQTAGFKAYQFANNPTNSTWTDKTAPAIATADAFAVHPPITLTNNDSGLGSNHTIYGTDQIARAHVAPGTTDYWVIITTGTPTFGTTTDMQFCVTYLLD